MFKFNKIASNMSEVEVETGKVLFSYSTPVAANVNNTLIVTNRFYSVTTSRHINKWLNGCKAIQVDPSVIEALLG